MKEKTKNNGYSLNNLKVALITLGCDKNRVDAEQLLFKLTSIGFKIAMEVNKADLIIVNTCGFIKSAIDESENIINQVLKTKKEKAKVIICGCYSQRFYDDVKVKYPNVDEVMTISQNENIEEIVAKLYSTEIEKVESVALDRLLSTPKHYAYLKISDGCNNFCTYCTIPMIRGRYKSVPMENILAQANELCERGVKELIIIAQDVTRYGLDLYKELKLVELLKELTKIEKLRCVRLHYCYPEMVTDELINEIVTNQKIAKYIDIPFQHINDRILKLMNRKSNSANIKELVRKLKENNIKIRSTFMVGFPTENANEFGELVTFLKQEKLDYVGFFKYSRESGTKAYEMQQVKEVIKDYRLKKVQKVQTKIMKINNKKMLGTVVSAVIEGFESNGIYVARTMQNSPEVDTVIYIKSTENLNIGEMYNVKLKKCLQWDFEGEIV